MKKITCLIVAVTVVLSFNGLALAEKKKNAAPQEETTTQGPQKKMMGHGMMDKGMMKMMHMHGMMQRSPAMVSSNDGGVIVLSGSKLYKYDKNLKLVGETEVKMDKECCMMGMKGMMKGKKGCPMMGGMDDNTEEEAPEEEPAAQPDVED